MFNLEDIYQEGQFTGAGCYFHDFDKLPLSEVTLDVLAFTDDYIAGDATVDGHIMDFYFDIAEENLELNAEFENSELEIAVYDKVRDVIERDCISFDDNDIQFRPNNREWEVLMNDDVVYVFPNKVTDNIHGFAGMSALEMHVDELVQSLQEDRKQDKLPLLSPTDVANLKQQMHSMWEHLVPEEPRSSLESLIAEAGEPAVNTNTESRNKEADAR